MIVFIVLGSLGFLIIAALWFTQRTYLKNLLELSRKKRQERMAEINDNEIHLTKQGLDSLGDQNILWRKYVYVAVYVFFGIVAWVLFFVFAVTGKVTF